MDIETKITADQAHDMVERSRKLAKENGYLNALANCLECLLNAKDLDDARRRIMALADKGMS